MRFDEIGKFSVDQLVLDQGNYRFSKAEDQLACVKKIYTANPPYFRGLMKSIAEDDLGEPLLVYVDESNNNIVADGNRRLSALKVLHSEEFAPSPALVEYAAELRKKHSIDFSNIQAQVSNQKSLVSKTVFERHSGGKNGTSRVPWNAYAAARFGFDEHIGDDKEWYIMALLSKTEEANPELGNFIDSNGFSYEVFRRLVRAGVKLGRISENIFSERGERIKKTAAPALVQDAIDKARTFILAIKNKEISLSRKEEGAYADSQTVDGIVSTLPLSPDNQALEDAKKSSVSGEDSSGSGEEADEASSSSQAEEEVEKNEGGAAGNVASNSDTQQNGETGSDNGPSSGNGSSSSNGIEYGVGESEKIKQKLDTLKSRKLNGLYNSLCRVSLNKHPALMYVGAWSFLEVLAKCAGNTNQDFPAFFRNKFSSFGIDRHTGKDCGAVLDEISKFGNSTKHSKNATPMSAIQLKNDFEVLEPLILGALEQAIQNNS